MKNSESYFENRDCKYYPCHNDIEDINCMFCYCPLYSKEYCPGSPKYIGRGDDVIKDCSECIFPHKSENYDIIMKFLGNK